jgi:hydrogenase maturation protein HypF
MRVRGRVEGTVQGVGFRPFVHRLAAELQLAGYVRNDERGVLLEVEGPADSTELFFARLRDELPPLARIDRLARQAVTATGAGDFVIAPSESAGAPSALVAPDAATCEDCLLELFDPGDRRYRYPFLNCTNCGPRFTIVRGVPYDRPNTTMAGFEMCAACRAEYEDPSDRRFHAQPNACPECGPRLSMPLEDAAELLRGGAVLAVKGLGGYHLACRADDEDAVAALRARKHREDRPFALMAADVQAARALVELSDGDEGWLTHRARPIVIAPRTGGARVAPSVAPRTAELGVMLPYTPLHHLLVRAVGAPLVMTSGNVSDEPIAYGDEDARERLASIADAFLAHDRPIQTRTDDSVMRTTGGRTITLRRSRGFVPDALALPVAAVAPVLACGAELKNTFCLAKGTRAWMGHHIGDLKNFETLESFRDGVAHFERLFDVDPALVVHDLHPDYLSTRYALERDGVRLLAVGHHHAHLAACLAEHGETGPAVGAIFDGSGYGPDGTVWGGELLVGDLHAYRRAGHLWPVRLPGGDSAAREPWRMACAWLLAAQEEEPAIPPRLAGEVDPERWSAVAAMARSGLASPLTTSAGRLFDAVAALAGVRARVSYEGQAAVELEAGTSPEDCGAYTFTLLRGADGAVVIDPRAVIRCAARDAADGEPAGVISARFHSGLAAATARACGQIAERNGLGTVVLGGGVFANRRLLEGCVDELSDRGLRVLAPELLPPGDGGIAFGQAAIGAARGHG